MSEEDLEKYQKDAELPGNNWIKTKLTNELGDPRRE